MFLKGLCFRIICLIFIAFTSIAGAAESDLLKAGDVSKIMKQIFDQHVNKKEISSVILQHAFQIYFDQFDPQRVYLLSSETDPWTHMSDSDLLKVIAQYKGNNFSAFEKMNDAIQTSIRRARQNRAEIMKDPDALFSAKSGKPSSDREGWQDPDLKIPFAKSNAELIERTRNELINFINLEKREFGESNVLKNKAQTLDLFKRQLKNNEDHYLYVDAKGDPLPPAQKENLFILHVLKALASSLDAHTTFYTPTEAYEMKVRLEKEFEGIGVVLQEASDGSVVVNQVVQGGPAARSGQIIPKDHIIAIDGVELKGLPFEQVMAKLRGKNGSTVALKIVRHLTENGKPSEKVIDLVLKREPIAVNDNRVTYTYEKYDDGIIAKITLPAFYQGDNGISSENDLKKALRELRTKGNLYGLIIDMRENSGGFLSQAVKVAGMFITNGVVVISKYNNGEEHIYRDMDSHVDYRGPLVILTSRATASAAEIVAETLQDYGIALVVGDDRTYGKGTIQSQTVTDDKSASYFKVTVGEYYTVSGKSPQIRGVKADILVPSQFSKERIGEEFLEYALPPDNIHPVFKDELKDIEASLKPWYLRYYMPTLQSKVTAWRQMLPSLKQNSENRIANNRSFQLFLKIVNGEKPAPNSEEAREMKALRIRLQNPNTDDLQLQEAQNIVKDMINMHARPEVRQPGIDYADTK